MCDDTKKCANVNYIDDLDDISLEDTFCSSDPGNGVAEAEVNGIKHPFLFIALFFPPIYSYSLLILILSDCLFFCEPTV
jgi:hypothetical protein